MNNQVMTANASTGTPAGAVAGPALPRCSLWREIELTPATLADWRPLAALHYRSHQLGGPDRLFAMRYRGQAVALIAYCLPGANLAGRNRALAPLLERLPIRGRLRFWNTHLRTISRVVVDPNWRGLGLAADLVRRTLPMAGVPYVEALAAMGRVHPFFEQGGMTPYPVVAPAASERLREALATAGLDRRDTRSVAQLLRTFNQLDPATADWLKSELDRWIRGYLGAKRGRTMVVTLEQACGYACRFLYSQPAYYLWARDAAGRPSSEPFLAYNESDGGAAAKGKQHDQNTTADAGPGGAGNVDNGLSDGSRRKRRQSRRHRRRRRTRDGEYHAERNTR